MRKVLVKKELNKRKEFGFSLIEMMIAITIFLAVMAAVFGVLRIGL